MERKKLERKIIRLVGTYVRTGVKLNVDVQTRIIMDAGLDSMDSILLSDSIERDFNMRIKESDWNVFWSNSEVTVKQLCDFIEKKQTDNSKKNNSNGNKR